MPRHPPCTLHRLTTFTDHRPRRAGMVGPCRTATRVTPRDAHDTRSVPRSHRKGARLVTPASTRDRPKRRRSARTLASAGGESATHKKTLRDKTIHLSKSFHTGPSARWVSVVLANADEGTPVEQDPIVRVPSKRYQEIVGQPSPRRRRRGLPRRRPF